MLVVNSDEIEIDFEITNINYFLIMLVSGIVSLLMAELVKFFFNLINLIA